MHVWGCRKEEGWRGGALKGLRSLMRGLAALASLAPLIMSDVIAMCHVTLRRDIGGYGPPA